MSQTMGSNCTLVPVLCVCVVWQGMCAGTLHGDRVPQVYSLLYPKSVIVAALPPASSHARQDWTDV